MANPLSNPAGNVAPRWVYQAILVEMTDKTLYGLHATQRHKEIRGIFNSGIWPGSNAMTIWVLGMYAVSYPWNHIWWHSGYALVQATQCQFQLWYIWWYFTVVAHNHVICLKCVKVMNLLDIPLINISILPIEGNKAIDHFPVTISDTLQSWSDKYG